jgi:predicted SAM-dependent methyltransferase
MQGEVSKWRSLILPFAIGNGIDIGYGGYALSPTTINMDLPGKYSHGTDPQHLTGDGRKLEWFRDNTLDYVFSSHVLEDFSTEEKKTVLAEWWRVVKAPMGYLILLLPDEKRYREYCASQLQGHNPRHKDMDFGLKKCLELVITLPSVVIVRKQELFTLPGGLPDYNFMIVAMKRGIKKG